MSDYSQITFFTPKDSLATGNPNKIIYGSDVDAELSAISTAIATKADVDGDAIGAGTPATELSVDNLKLDANKIISTNTDGDIELEPNGAGYVVITNVDVAAGEIDGTTIGANSAAAGTFTTANATTVDTTNLEVTNLKAKDGTAAGSIANSTGIVTLASSVLTTTDINGGTVDGAVIGGATPAAITGTTLKANTSLELATGATVTAILDEDAMTSNSATALATQQSIKAYVDSQVTAQDLDVTTDSGTIAIDLDSETLTVAGGTGLDTSATGNTVTVAIDSTVATLTGTQTLSNKTLTSPDINTPDIDGGTIDGVTIGGSSAGAITGTTITGTSFVSSGDMTFGDNDKAIFGAGSDLQIYHSGTHSFISDQGTGNMLVLADNFEVNSASNTANKITAATGGAVTLFHNNAAKLATTATGIDVTGTVTADGLTVDTDTGITLKDGSDTRTGKLFFDSGVFQFRATGSGDVSFATTDSNTRRLLISGNTGDISFYEDTGTTPKFFWDASEERLGLGTSSPASSLHISQSSPVITLTDSDAAGINSIIGGSSGRLIFNADADDYGTGEIIFQQAGSEAARIDSSGNLLVGTTVDDGQSIGSGSQNGIVLAGESQYIQRGDNANLWLSKPSGATNSEFIKFYENTSHLGTIGVTSLDLNIYSSTTGHAGLRFGNGYVAPTNNAGAITDAAISLGLSSHRFTDLYLSGGLPGTASGSLVINENGADSDFRVESDTQTHALFVDAGNSRVGIGESSPSQALDVNGNVLADRFITATGTTGSLATSGTADILNLSGASGLWQVSVRNSDGGINWRNSSQVFFNGVSSSSIQTSDSANVTVTMSGTNIRLTNTSGTTIALTWSVTRLL